MLCFSSDLLHHDPSAAVHHFFKKVVPSLCTTVRSKPCNFSSLRRQGTKDANSVNDFMTALLKVCVPEREKLIDQCLEKDRRTDIEECKCVGCVGDGSLRLRGVPEVVNGNGLALSAKDRLKISALML